ncbi:unnamed protein product [Brassica rapa subsp. trilocularis]
MRAAFYEIMRKRRAKAIVPCHWQRLETVFQLVQAASLWRRDRMCSCVCVSSVSSFHCEIGSRDSKLA